MQAKNAIIAVKKVLLRLRVHPVEYNLSSRKHHSVSTSIGSMDSIRREKGKIPSPNVSLGLGVPSLSLRDNMNPISLISFGSNLCFCCSTTDGLLDGRPPHAGRRLFSGMSIS